MTNPNWTDLRTWLQQVKFPCDRTSLVGQASAAGADDDALGHLHALPDISYEHADDVLGACEGGG